MAVTTASKCLGTRAGQVEGRCRWWAGEQATDLARSRGEVQARAHSYANTGLVRWVCAVGESAWPPHWRLSAWNSTSDCECAYFMFIPALIALVLHVPPALLHLPRSVSPSIWTDGPRSTKSVRVLPLQYLKLKRPKRVCHGPLTE